MNLLKQVNLIVEDEEEVETPPAKKPAAEEPPADDVETDEVDTDTDDSEEQSEDVGTVAEREGYEKSKKEIFAFGKTRPATLLTKNEKIGGLDVTQQYVINPKTGEWSFRVALQGQSEASMKEHTTGKDPTSLAKHLQKKNKVTAHWLADNLDPPADQSIQDDDDEGLDKEYAKDGVPNEEDQDAVRSHRSTKGVHEGLVKEEHDDESYVVIGNGGPRMGQTLWPSTDKPKLYTKVEAENIVKKQKDGQNAFNSIPGVGHLAWHVKHLNDAHNYVTGKALNSIRDLQDRIEGGLEESALLEAKPPANYSKAEKLAWLYGRGAAEDHQEPSDVDFDTAEERAAYFAGYETIKKIKEGSLTEGGHDWGRSFPVDKFPTLASVKKYINDNVEFDNDDPYSDSHQLKKIGVKQYHTGEKSRSKIENALLDKAKKWEDLLADKFKDENGKEFWIVAGWLAEAHMYDKDDEFTKKILAADKIEHPVETQWHHDIMTAHGFKPITKTGIGFARHYDYENEHGHKIRASTGINADHWQDLTNKGKMGYWRELEPHLKSLKSSGYHGTVKRNDNGKVSDVKVFVPEK